MNDKYATSRFNFAPTISKGRSRFDLSHNIRFTCNTGDFVCTGVEEVYPGETFSQKDGSFIRLETSLHQTMDTAYYEEAHFFVPLRLIWTDFDKFMGASDDPWVQETEYEVPQIILSVGFGSVAPMSILNQIGVPSGNYFRPESDSVSPLSISALPLRAIFQCWNDYYRDENYDTIIAFDKGSDDIQISNLAFALNGGSLYPHFYDSEHMILRVNRFHDLFSSVLPAPQRGDPVELGLAGSAPISGSIDLSADGGLVFQQSDDPDFTAEAIFGSPSSVGQVATGSIMGKNERSDMYPQAFSDVSYKSGLKGEIASGAVADLSEATAITVNQLRLAIVSQAIKERDARTGTRPNELIYGIWGVESNSLELDRPEFLAGRRIPLNMMEVLQTSETGTTVLGTSAGHSKTYSTGDGYLKSFTEYGLIVSFAYIRTARSYSQGIDKKFFKKHKYDFYDPMLDNIGEVDMKGKELLSLTASGFATSYLDSPIGYQEPWYHLKSHLDRDFGYFQAGISGTLDSWHYGDSYVPGSDPVIDSEWLKEGPERVDRTIAVESGTAHQWRIMIHRELYATRQMSLFNKPNTFGFGSN